MHLMGFVKVFSANIVVKKHLTIYSIFGVDTERDHIVTRRSKFMEDLKRKQNVRRVIREILFRFSIQRFMYPYKE